MDAFPTAHRAHPSIVGFSYLLPTCAGRLVSKELKALNRILNVSKAPFTTVLGGAKVSDRLEAIDTLIANKRADKVLLCGLIANVFLKAARKIDYDIGVDKEEKMVERASTLMADYPDTFELPMDVAVARSEERVEVPISELKKGDKVFDIGSKTIDHYSRIIRSSGTIFMSGPCFVIRPDLRDTNKLHIWLQSYSIGNPSSNDTISVNSNINHLRCFLS